MFKLKSLNLLKDSDIHVKRHNHNDKFNFVYNDFHSKSTNPGYSRNDKGGFFTRWLYNLYLLLEFKYIIMSYLILKDFIWFYTYW